jgi:hypothetical protein
VSAFFLVHLSFSHKSPSITDQCTAPKIYLYRFNFYAYKRFQEEMINAHMNVVSRIFISPYSFVLFSPSSALCIISDFFWMRENIIFWILSYDCTGLTTHCGFSNEYMIYLKHLTFYASNYRSNARGTI